jgi:PAS domain-containing protein
LTTYKTEVRNKRKLAEQVLKEADLKFKTLFDNASDGLLIAQISDRKFSTANRKICEMLGYTIQKEIQT